MKREVSNVLCSEMADKYWLHAGILAINLNEREHEDLWMVKRLPNRTSETSGYVHHGTFTNEKFDPCNIKPPNMPPVSFLGTAS